MTAIQNLVPHVQVPAVRFRVFSSRAIRTAGIHAGSFAAVILLWYAAASAYGTEMLFPGPETTWTALLQRLKDGSLLESSAASLSRILAGFIMGSVLGIALGLLAGASRIVDGMISPFITFFRFVPPLAWFAPMLVWFGTGDASKIVLIMYTSVFVVAVNTLAGVHQIPLNLRRMAAAAGANAYMKMFWIMLPASVPFIVAGMRVAMGNAFMTVVSAEMLGASEGLGVMINNSMTSTNVPNVFVSIICLGLLGLIFDRLFVLAINTLGKRFRSGSSDAIA